MARAVGFLASFVAVIGAGGGLVRWLHAENVALWVIAVVLVAAAIALVAAHLLIRTYTFLTRRDIPIAYLGFYFIGGVVGISFILLGLGGSDVLFVVGAVVYFASVVGPLILDLFEIDKASRKPCPDCCEEVKVRARVCRYCGHRWPNAPGCDPG
jgi:hypothetical protein